MPLHQEIISEKIKLLEPVRTGSIGRYNNLRVKLRRAVNPQDTEGCLEFGNADAGRDPFNPESHIKLAAIEAMENPGNDLVYTPTQGLLEIREAIAEKCEKENKFSVNPYNEVQITVGTQMSIFCTTQSLINPGDKVLIPDPDYSAYQRIVKYAGGIPISFPFKELSDKSIRFDVEAMERIATPDIKLMMFTNPHNPCGYVMTKDDLEAIAEIAKKNDFLVFSDELYEKLVYEGNKHTSLVSLPDMKEKSLSQWKLLFPLQH